MELKFSAKLVCGDKSYPLEPGQKVTFDPVVEHLIALRGCSLELNEVKNRTLEELRELKDTYKSQGTTEELKRQLKEFIICNGLKMKKIKNDENVDDKKHEGEKGTKNEKKGGRKREQRAKRTKYKSIGVIRGRRLGADSIPNFPRNYPFQDCVEEKLRTRHETEHKVMFQGVLQEKAVAKLMEHFVISVIIQSGFSVPTSSAEIDINEAVALLVDVAHRFLKTFLFVLRRNIHSEVFTKREREADNNEKDLWGPLETTLKDIGFGSIIELQRFYYEKIVKKHDRLLKEVACSAGHVHKLRELTSQLTYKTLMHP